VFQNERTLYREAYQIQDPEERKLDPLSLSIPAYDKLIQWIDKSVRLDKTT
jgi:hypothetical protein